MMKLRSSRLWWLVCAAFLLLLVGGGGTAVFAHDAVIERSSPANGEVLPEAPTQVVAWFAEELVSGESSLAVFDAQGQQRDNGDGGVDLNDPDHASMIVTLPPLPDGSYTVQWRAVLLDGDASSGAFAFAIGENQTVALPAAPATGGAGRFEGAPLYLAVGLTAVILLLGVIFFRRRAAKSHA